MTDPELRRLSISEAVEALGLPRRTIQRRGQAWENGDRSSYAIRSGRTGGDRGDRLYDPIDIERVRRQLDGQLPLTVTAEQYVQQRDNPQ